MTPIDILIEQTLLIHNQTGFFLPLPPGYFCTLYIFFQTLIYNWVLLHLVFYWNFSSLSLGKLSWHLFPVFNVHFIRIFYLFNFLFNTCVYGCVYACVYEYSYVYMQTYTEARYWSLVSFLIILHIILRHKVSQQVWISSIVRQAG